MSSGLELGTILRGVPESWQDQPVLCAIHDAYAFGWANRLWSKREAAWLAFRANMERGLAYGHGNRAARRQADIETAEWFDHHTRLSEADVDALSHRYE